MINKSEFRLRLRVRIGNAFSTNEVLRSITVAGREVTIRSQKRGEPLSKTTWIIFEAGGFTTEASAHDFGEQLRLMIEIASLHTRLGSDTGLDSSEDSVNEKHLRARGILKPHERIMPTLHGLAIFPDDGNTRFFSINGNVELKTDPARFESAIIELSEILPITPSASTNCLKLLNHAIIEPQPLAKMILAFSAVETIGQNETWSEKQIELIEKLATEAEEGANYDNRDTSEIADALRRSTHRIGLRQGVMRILIRLDLNHLRKEWDTLYSIRSGIVHGTNIRTQQELSEAAFAAIELCRKIILALIEQDGIKQPSSTRKYVGKI